MSKLKITQVKSQIGRPEHQRKVLKGAKAPEREGGVPHRRGRAIAMLRARRRSCS